MGHPHHRLAPGDHRGQERVGGVDEVAHRGHGHRAEAGQLAHLALDHPAPQQGGEIDPHEERIRQAYGAQKYDRLKALKRRFDPTNLFRLNQNIVPD